MWRTQPCGSLSQGGMRRRDGKEPGGGLRRPRRHRAPDLPVSPPDSHRPASLPSAQQTASGPEHPLQTPRPAPEPAPPGFHWPFCPTAHRGPHSPLEVSGPDARPTQMLSVVTQGKRFTQLANSARFMEHLLCAEGHNEPDEHLCPPAAHRLRGRW